MFGVFFLFYFLGKNKKKHLGAPKKPPIFLIKKLYAELVQNRSFEYSPTERKEWHPLSYWEYISPGYSYGKISVETTKPVNANNPHYIVLEAEHIGKEEKYTGESGVGIKNTGFAGMVIRAGEKYNLSFFARQLSDEPIALKLSLAKYKR